MKILVVEDELLVADDLVDKLERLNYRVTAVVGSYSDALKSVQEEKPDLALLDIELKGPKTGIDLAKELSAMHIPFIYLTGIQDMTTYLKAKDTAPLKNLAKPIDLLNLRNALLEAGSPISATKEQTIPMIMDRNGTRQRIDPESIIYIQAARSYCDIYFKDGKTFTLASPMGNVIKKLRFSKLVPISRSCHVNIKFVTGMRGNEIIMTQNTYLPITDSYKDTFSSYLNLL